jgi:hypothetical protein
MKYGGLFDVCRPLSARFCHAAVGAAIHSRATPVLKASVLRAASQRADKHGNTPGFATNVAPASGMFIGAPADNADTEAALSARG